MREPELGWAGVLAERVRARLDPGRPDADEVIVSPRGGHALRLRRLHGPRTEGAVILCHGLGGNSRVFDLPGCLAPFLVQAGFDVFLLDLSGKRLDDWQVDAVTALEGVALATGSRDLAWIGHSLGGWLGLTAPFDGLAPRLVVGLGTTLFFERNEALGRTLRVARRLGALNRAGVVPQATLGALEAPLMGRVAMPSWLSWLSPPRLRGPLVRQLHALAIEDIPLPIVEALLGWVEGRDDASLPRRASARTSSDVVLFAGAGDAWAPVASVEKTTALLNARERGRASIVRLGNSSREDAGLSPDDRSNEIGHVEMLFGEDRERLVFEPIVRLLRAQRTLTPIERTG